MLWEEDLSSLEGSQIVHIKSPCSPNSIPSIIFIFHVFCKRCKLSIFSGIFLQTIVIVTNILFCFICIYIFF